MPPGDGRPEVGLDAGDRREAPLPPALGWLMAAALLVAAGVSAFLLQQTLAGGAVAGCGSGSGCDTVLSSRWSRWLGVPVAALSLATYLGLLGATRFMRPGVPLATRGPACRAAVALSIAALGAAAWFAILQVGVVGAFCKYCLAVHAAGVVGAILVLREALALRGAATGPLLAGAGMLGALVVGQIAVDPANYVPVPAPVGQLPPTASSTAVGPGALPIDIKRLPVLGRRDAPVVMLGLFDYACGHCRMMHGFLKQARQLYGDQLGILVVPMPLDSKCNPYNPATNPPFDESCERARIALAVWRADPTAFEQVDDWMFEPEAPRTAAELRAFAEKAVGADKLARALGDPWIDQTIKQSVELQHASRGDNGQSDVIPKLFLRGKMMAGLPRSAEALTSEMESILRE